MRVLVIAQEAGDELQYVLSLSGAELVCETSGFNQGTCESVGCCHWNNGGCWSSVGQNNCDSAFTDFVDPIDPTDPQENKNHVIDVKVDQKSENNTSSLHSIGLAAVSLLFLITLIVASILVGLLVWKKKAANADDTESKAAKTPEGKSKTADVEMVVAQPIQTDSNRMTYTMHGQPVIPAQDNCPVEVNV